MTLILLNVFSYFIKLKEKERNIVVEREVYLTSEGLEKIESELDELKVVKRKEIAERIKQALAFGDISENSEYDEAKNEQAQLEIKIAKLEAILRNAKIIDEDDISTDIVTIGARVKIKDLEFDDEEVDNIKTVGDAKNHINNLIENKENN